MLIAYEKTINTGLFKDNFTVYIIECCEEFTTFEINHKYKEIQEEKKKHICPVCENENTIKEIKKMRNIRKITNNVDRDYYQRYMDDKITTWTTYNKTKRKK